LVARPWRKLCRAVERLSGSPSDAELHRIRIKAKMCRYAAEAVEPITGKRARRFARRIEDVQTILGELHDAAVERERLRASVGAVDARAAFVAGELSAFETVASGEARRAWRRAWRKAAQKRLRFWRD
jgi:CHAD domain-containing protein